MFMVEVAVIEKYSVQMYIVHWQVNACVTTLYYCKTVYKTVKYRNSTALAV